MKKLIIAGYVGNDATVSDLPSGTQVINFNLAVSEKVKEEYKTTWFRCSRFTNNVSLAPYLKKGTYLIIEGRPDIESYVDKDGVTKSNLKCIVDNIHFGGNSKSDDGNSTPAPSTQTNPREFPQANQTNSFVDGPKEEEHDDLPF